MGIWSDATYMLPPFLAAAGDFQEAMKQIEGYRKYLYNEKDQLYSHMWNDEKKVLMETAATDLGNILS